jgi:signal transduction histidine kinase
MPRSLRARLFWSYAGLVLLSVALASGASLALFGLQLQRSARLEMAENATRLAGIATALAEQDRPLAPEVLRRVLRSGAPLRGRPEIFVVDEQGRAVLRVPPEPPPNRRSPRGAPPPAPPPRWSERRLYPTTTLDDREPVVRESAVAGGPRLLYVTVPLAVGLLLVEGDPPQRLHLAIARPVAEFRGLWRPLLPSILLVGSLALVLASVAALALTRSITRPLEALTRASEHMAGGDYGARVTPTGADETQRLARAFNAMAVEVDQAHRRQREFVANVGHDLRTPLTTIRGFAEALLDGTARTARERHQAATAIEGSAERMAQLVDRLIELARLEGQQGGLELAAVNVAELLDRVVEDHARQAQLQEVRLIVDAAPELVLRADATWLRRAVGNLVDNAIRHSPPGSDVALEARQVGDRVEVEVIDHGEGIASADLPHVFERFFRGDDARRTGGSGLGLNIAREIVQAHGGEIHIDSTAGAGTRVTLQLATAG